MAGVGGGHDERRRGMAGPGADQPAHPGAGADGCADPRGRRGGCWPGPIRPALRPGWGRLRHAGGYVQTYWMSPGDISSTSIDRLWTPDTDATVVTRAAAPRPAGATTVGVMVRYHTGGPLAEPPLTRIQPVVGSP